MIARKPLPKSVRFKVFERDQFVCQYCGQSPPHVILEVDHIVPVNEGGISHIDNLATGCFECNRGKGRINLNVIPPTLQEKAAEIAEREAQLLGYREIIQAKIDREDNDVWQVAETLVQGANKDGFGRDWLHSIRKFLQLLDFHEVMEAAEIARTKKPYSDPDRFRYFCGICWNKVRANDDQRRPR